MSELISLFPHSTRDPASKVDPSPSSQWTHGLALLVTLQHL